MRRLTLALVLVATAATPAQASLMFSDEELRALQATAPRADVTAGAGAGATLLQGNIHLSAILYYGPRQWSIWINGTRVEPGQIFAGARVDGISENHVDLLIGTDTPRVVRLRPNQTWLAGYGVVVEGAYP